MPMWVGAVLVGVVGSAAGAMTEDGPQRFSVHGTVTTPPDVADRSAFLLGTRVVLDGGSYVGFLKVHLANLGHALLAAAHSWKLRRISLGPRPQPLVLRPATQFACGKTRACS